MISNQRRVVAVSQRQFFEEFPIEMLDKWNQDIVDGNPIPVREILQESVFYPASGLDGDPIKYLGKQFQSFVYIDYGIERDKVLAEFNNFTGYELSHCREPEAAELRSIGKFPTSPVRNRTTSVEGFTKLIDPFAIWALFRRKPSFDDNHGPTGFSLLYVGGEGLGTFRVLYCRLQIAPSVICLIQPGTGFGRNWTNFEAPDGHLANVVLRNPAGPPRFLLYGGGGEGAFYRHAPWPGFENQVAVFHGRLRLFSATAPEQFNIAGVRISHAINE